MNNSVILIGRIANEVKLNENGELNILVSIPRATNNKECDIIPCLISGKIAENTAEYCKKYDLIGIRGRIECKVDDIKIIAEKITFLASKKEHEDNIKEN